MRVHHAGHGLRIILSVAALMLLASCSSVVESADQSDGGTAFVEWHRSSSGADNSISDAELIEGARQTCERNNVPIAAVGELQVLYSRLGPTELDQMAAIHRLMCPNVANPLEVVLGNAEATGVGQEATESDTGELVWHPNVRHPQPVVLDELPDGRLVSLSPHEILISDSEFRVLARITAEDFGKRNFIPGVMEVLPDGRLVVAPASEIHDPAVVFDPDDVGSRQLLPQLPAEDLVEDGFTITVVEGPIRDVIVFENGHVGVAGSGRLAVWDVSGSEPVSVSGEGGRPPLMQAWRDSGGLTELSEPRCCIDRLIDVGEGRFMSVSGADVILHNKADGAAIYEWALPFSDELYFGDGEVYAFGDAEIYAVEQLDDMSFVVGWAGPDVFVVSIGDPVPKVISTTSFNTSLLVTSSGRVLGIRPSNDGWELKWLSGI